MIELPESRMLADQFAEHLTGKTVANAVANSSPHKFAWLSGDSEAYRAALCGKSVTGSNAYGGMAELVIEGIRLVFTDGANVRYFKPGEKLPPKHQLHIEFDDDSSLVCSVQMYGAMFLMDVSTPDEGYYLSSKTKVSPLSDEFTPGYFLKHMDSVKQNYSVKAFLATEQRFPGLGNGVLQDILRNARLRPKRKLETLTFDEKERLFTCVRETLFSMLAQRGRDTERDIFGIPGGYKTVLSRFTYKSPCSVCGGEITREAYLGGNVYYCPVCQK